MKYNNIVWDWNGTILNDTLAAFKSTNILLERYGYPTITLEYYRDNIDTPIVNFYSKIFDLNKHSMQMLDDEWGILYNQHSDEIVLQEGAEELLRYFTDKNCHQIILSAFKTDEITKYAHKFSVEICFDDILGTQGIAMESKTIRGRRYMNEHELPPEKTLYIGDTVHDYDTALALGIDCVLFSGGQQSPKLLHKCGVPVIDSFSQIEKYLF